MKIYKNNQWQDYKFEVSVPNFSGASSSVAGVSGLVPAPSAGSSTRYLGANGAWQDLPTIPSLDGYAKISTANTWTAAQVFSTLGINYERYGVETFSGTSATPTTSVVWIVATGAFTLDMSNIAAGLEIGQGTVFTAVLAASSDYALTITNAGDSGNIRYCGSASDIAIKSTGTLLNIFMVKGSSGTLVSVIQATALSAS